MTNSIAIKLGLVAAVAIGLMTGLGSTPAQARVLFGLGLGVPYYYPPPYYYYPPPPVVAPPPIYTAPTYAPTYVQPPPQLWYYCDNPPGYYPHIQYCASGWREVPARP
jgi:hypothetical protein